MGRRGDATSGRCRRHSRAMSGNPLKPESQGSEERLTQRPSLKGAADPPYSTPNVETWSRPHSFVVHRREELGLILAAVLVVVPNRIVAVAGFEYADLFGSSSMREILGVLAVSLMPASVGLLAFRTQVPPRGWVTVDVPGSRIVLRGSDGRPRSADAVWPLDSISAVGSREGGSVDTLSSGTLVLESGNRALMIRVPRGDAAQLAASLERLRDGRRGR